jgi:hypothetical protein
MTWMRCVIPQETRGRPTSPVTAAQGDTVARIRAGLWKIILEALNPPVMKLAPVCPWFSRDCSWANSGDPLELILAPDGPQESADPLTCLPLVWGAPISKRRKSDIL